MIKDQILARKSQIEKEISKIHVLNQKKSQRDYKSQEAFLDWQNRQQGKLDDLYSELAILDYPEGYYEVPLAVAASELGLTLGEVLEIASEGLLQLTYEGAYRIGSRITRDELARAIDVGAETLLAIARQRPSEIFHAVCPEIEAGNIEALQTAYDRIERNDSCINPFAIALELGIAFLSGDLQEINQSLAFISRRDNEDLAATLVPLKMLAERLPTQNHLMDVIRERILATANGDKEVPFRDTFSPFVSSRRRSQMDENQKRALFVKDVVMHAIEKFKFVKYLESSRSYISDRRPEEIDRVIGNAIFTALEAERTYVDSPSSKLFVDKYVELSPKWSKPPEKVIL